jgi:hypothetical protein
VSYSRIAGAARRTAGILVLVGMSVSATACYTYRPLSTAPVAGTEVKLELNDRGRAALADSVGPAVRSITGSLADVSSGRYDLRIHTVEFFSGMFQQWSGERLVVPEEYVLRSSERRFDRKRSWLVGVGSAAALAAAIISIDLLGGAEPSPTPVPPPPVGDQ